MMLPMKKLCTVPVNKLLLKEIVPDNKCIPIKKLHIETQFWVYTHFSMDMLSQFPHKGCKEKTHKCSIDFIFENLKSSKI